MMRWVVLALAVGARAQVGVPLKPAAGAKPIAVRDKRYGVRFEVPAGWTFGRKDHQVSTFHLDARSAARKAELRGVASMDFNPFPASTFSGGLFYFSVLRHANDNSCARQAHGAARDLVDVGGMSFRHGHDETREACVVLRDEVYTAYRRGSCYRFDLVVTTFCGETVGVREMTEDELSSVREGLGGILDSVVLDWGGRGGGKVEVGGRRVSP